MFDESLLLIAVLAPTLGSLLLPVIGPLSTRLRNALAFLLVAAALVCSVGLIGRVVAGATVTAGWLPGCPGLGSQPMFSADALAVFTACVSSLVSAIVVLYSTGYIRDYPHQDEYYFMVVLFLGAMMGLVFAANLAVLYVFWEITAIASWRLIGFFRDREMVRRADKAFLITAFGAVSMMLGFVVLYVQAGSLDFATLKDYFATHPMPDLAIGLILLGILSKSATLPFHTWLPDAGVAPSPVTALLHAAVLVKIGVYVFARLFLATFPLTVLKTVPYGIDWNLVVLIVAAASALVSAGAAMLETDLKRIIAFSTISQIAFIFLGFASGSDLGAAGALLYILMHGLSKGGLFLCAGIIEHGLPTHTKDIRKMGGLIRTMPITAVSFLLCSFSVMGIPPLGGFFSKYMVIGGAVQGEHPWIALVFVFGAVLTIIYLLRVFRMVFLGEPTSSPRTAVRGVLPAHETHETHEGTPVMVGSVVVLAALSLIAGPLVYPPAQLALVGIGKTAAQAALAQAALAQAMAAVVNYQLLWPILIPLAAGVLVLLLPKSLARLRGPIAVLATAAGVAVAASLFMANRAGESLAVQTPWAGFGLLFALKLNALNAFILVSAAGFGFLVVLFSLRFMDGRPGVPADYTDSTDNNSRDNNSRKSAKSAESVGIPHGKQFFAYLLFTLAMAAGAVLADHLITMLFFWEGMLCTTFGLIAIGRPGAFKTAIKALIIVGISDLCLMAGIALAGWLNHGDLLISNIHLEVHGLAALAMVLLAIGAMGKGGAMPFHSWIPDAATDAPMPFMALIPAAMEKLLGIYLLSRICLDMFHLTPESWVSTLLMVIGAATILLAVAMALVQKDYKRLLSYHAISQVGYMILGIGTATVFGVVGGLFHMINNALYKSLLFMTGGAVEHRTGTTDLAKLGGLARLMPVTFTCFIIAALSISGFPLTNGFFSKELIYEGAMDRNVIFYIAAVLGSFLTAASFLKLGHAAFLGKPASRGCPPVPGPGGSERHGEVTGAEDGSAHGAPIREAPLSMLAPMVLLAAGCLVFAYNPLPINKLLLPAVHETEFALRTVHVENDGPVPLHVPWFHGSEEHLAGWPTNLFLTVMTILVLAAAVVNHLVGVKRTGRGLGAVDHIHYAPVLHTIYDKAEQRWFDPYDLFMKAADGLARVGWWLDRLIDWIYEGLTVGLTGACTGLVRLAHTGSYSLYIVWALVGAAAVVAFLVRG